MDFDLQNMETYHYFMAGGGGLIVIAALLYFFKGKQLKVPAFVATTIGALAVGFGAGVITLGAAGYHWKDKEKEEKPSTPAGNQAKAKSDSSSRKQTTKNTKGGATPSAKLQLADLIVRVNELSEKPLSINLQDRKEKIAEQLKDLDTMESLSDEVAKERFAALTELLKPDAATLKKTGWNPTTAGNVGKTEVAANPFAKGTNKTALKALQERVEK